MAAICVFCASSDALDQRWLDLARDTGRELGRRGHRLVSGGGRVGMMGTVAEGARTAGAHTLGVIPQSLVDLEVADVASDELIVTGDMGERKNVLIERSDAFVTLPGGIGTLDELFEVWTTASLDLHRKPIVLLDPDGFYQGLLSWLSALADTAFVRRAAIEQITVADSVPAAFDVVEAALAGSAGQHAEGGRDEVGRV
ncbi:LOG family protein [Mangrovihabitans endophyticus]|uniref:Cytokinin riboside 5'-monophosphate phosphoribohydrolase n=1 Tax=Mangrovihabitans endophyticus TaxID=1751298 RepID=A0A8J3C4D2_9ACTN|nr:TIGR00730 family Rossman fold protein [Mangrovihabitans endophyticus]GGL08382.1 cytokinin riboside 5'-monophosphate phosphoribohydrolase [Mangrovihabitans endophyticus]